MAALPNLINAKSITSMLKDMGNLANPQHLGSMTQAFDMEQ